MPAGAHSVKKPSQHSLIIITTFAYIFSVSGGSAAALKTINNMTIRIPDGNAFRIRLTARNLISGEYTEAADLSNIDNLVINYVRRGIRFPHAYTIDEEGRATVADAGTLDCGFYGIELTGYYGGEKFRFYGKDLFEITTDTTDVIDPSNLIDIEITVKLNASGVSKDYVDHAINGMEASMETMQADLRDEIAEAGKVDDVKVNGVSVVFGKKANITVPTKVSDLTNDSEYQNEQQVQQKVDAAKITSADISVDGGTGTPSGSAGVSGNQLVIALHNIKGEKGDPGDTGATGPTGPQGESFQPIEDVSGLVLAHTTGQDNTKAMSQKGVTDTIGEYQEQAVMRIKNCYINNDVIASSSTQHCWYAKIKVGDVVKFTGTNTASSGKSVRIGFCSTKPALQASISSVASTSGTGVVTLTNVSDTDGYVVVNHASDIFIDHKIEIIRYAKAGELSDKASEKSLMDVAKSTSSVMAEIALNETAVSSDIYTIHGDTRTKTGCTMYKFDNVEEGKIYHVKGNVPTETYYVGYIFFDSDGVSISYGETGNGSNGRGFDTLIECPKGATTLYVGGYNYGGSVVKGEVLEFTFPTTDEQKKQVRDNLGIMDDTYMIPVDMVEEYLHSNFNVDGSILTYQPSQTGYDFVVCRKYAIEQGKDYYATARNGGADIVACVAYYDSEGDFIEFDSAFSPTGKKAFFAEKMNVPLNAASVIIRGANVNVGISNLPAEPSLYVGNRQVKKDVIPYVIEYHEAKIRSNLLVSDNGTDPTSATKIEDTLINSGWAVMWPSSYTPYGKPTQVIAMLHGHSGLVNENVMGYYNNANWKAWIYRYLSAGYAVVDINGYGVTSGTSANQYSKHWGCPMSVETLDKAFEYLKTYYNVADKMMLHGSSMGGTIAQNYAMAYPNKVVAVGLFAPATSIMFGIASQAVVDGIAVKEEIVNLWGYADTAEAKADDYHNFAGTTPFAKCLAWKDGTLVEVSWAEIASQSNIPSAILDYDYIEHFPVPLRVWQGTSDESVDAEYTQKVVDGYRRGGSVASIRLVQGKPHNLCTGSVAFVVDEAIDWFKRVGG